MERTLPNDFTFIKMKTNSVNQEQESLLTDSYGRTARKLRISVTDRCNLQCIYCMPKNPKGPYPSAILR